MITPTLKQAWECSRGKGVARILDAVRVWRSPTLYWSRLGWTGLQAFIESLNDEDYAK